jgi:hypothetical protein
MDLRRLREALHAVLAPDQPVPVVHRTQHAVELERPPLGRLGAVLGGPEGVVGDEQLRPVAREEPPQLLGMQALVRLPALGQLGKRDGASDRRLAHLRRPGDHREAVPFKHRERLGVSAGRDEDPGQATRGIHLGRRPSEHRGLGQPGKFANPEHRREAATERRIRVERGAQLRRSQPQAIAFRDEVQPIQPCGHIPVAAGLVGDDERRAWKPASLARGIPHPPGQAPEADSGRPEHQYQQRPRERADPRQRSVIPDDRQTPFVRPPGPARAGEPRIPSEQPMRQPLELEPTQLVEPVTARGLIHRRTD